MSASDIIESVTLMCGEPKPYNKENWQAVEYDCTLSRNGREFWQGPYRLGLGHVDINKPVNRYGAKLSEYELGMLYSWRNKPYARFKEKGLQCELAAKLAKYHKVKPAILDVLYSLLQDGSAHFYSYTFEQWCPECGYDSDSIKALSVFNACVDTGRMLAQAFNRDELETLNAFFQDY